jgi:hypothetical protein
VALEQTGMLTAAQIAYAMGHSQSTIQAGYRMPIQDRKTLAQAMIAADKLKGDVDPENFTEDELPLEHR